MNITQPSNTTVFFEAFPLCNEGKVGPSPLARHGGRPRHQERLNVTYADGHAKNQKARFNASYQFTEYPELQGLKGWWVVDGGPYDGQPNMVGTVEDDGLVH